MAKPRWTHVALAGLAGGLVLNLIDTPWSVLVMVPRMQGFLEGHGLQSDPLTGPWFLVTLVVFAAGIAWVHGLLREVRGGGSRSALLAGLVLLVPNRLFGFGNVLMGTLPARVFLGFSASFVVGTLVAAWTIGKLMDRLANG